MKDRYKPILRLLGMAVLALGLCVLGAGRACADVVGRLRFTVKNAGDKNEAPVAGAKIVLHDTANVRPDITLTSDAQGNATSPPLENHDWQATTTADNFQQDKQTIAVVADRTTDVEVLLETVGPEKVIVVKANKETTDKRNTTDQTRRDRPFIKTFPANAGNPQDFGRITQTAPGFVQDSVNQYHPRGEHSATTIFLNGFELPDVLQGRAGQLLVPDVIQSADIQTGGYAPEYGGETAAILNLSLRGGPITPFVSTELQGGEFSTFYGALTFGGQLGHPIGAPDAQNRQARALSYLFNFTGRRTQNALEPPQPDNQTAHNTGAQLTGFGNITYQAGSRDQIQLTLNSAPAYTQIANRTGLPGRFAPVGQGFGLFGARNADGSRPDVITDPNNMNFNGNALGAGNIQLASQDAAGQDINQRDTNDFGLLSLRHTFSTNVTGLLSFGLIRSGQEIKNNNHSLNIDPNAPGFGLPIDSSLEYDPTVIRNYHHAQIQGSMTVAQRKHTYKGGLLYDNQEGDESYQFNPGSQLALNALAATAANLAPQGAAQMDANGNPVLDVNGNPVFTPTGQAPLLKVHRTGFYAAGYLQDTWLVSRRTTLNYGVRLDWYGQKQNLGQGNVNDLTINPRFNLAYLLEPKTVGRLSYNRLFIQPPLAQGAVIGQAIQPETLNQYEASIEHQLAPGQTAKIAYYYKDIKDQIDTGLLIPGTQIGIYSSVNFSKGGVHGLELSYDLVPRNNVGLSSYVSYAYTIAKPNGFDNTGAQAPFYNDHDQLNTISAGLAYTIKYGAALSFNLYHGSGVASSVLASANPNSPTTLFNGARQPRTQLNLALSSGSRLFGGGNNAQSGTTGGRGGLALSVENLLDDRTVINFNSGFSGTRFQQGRRVLLSLSGNF